MRYAEIASTLPARQSSQPLPLCSADNGPHVFQEPEHGSSFFWGGTCFAAVMDVHGCHGCEQALYSVPTPAPCRRSPAVCQIQCRQKVA